MIRETSLKNNLLNQNFIVDWMIPSDLFYFDGHFYNRPVLPAVAIIDLSLELMKGPEFLNPKLKGVKSAKFSALLQPEQRVQIEYSAQGNLWAIVWKNPSTNETYAKLSLLLF